MKLLSHQQRLHQVNTEQLFDNYRIALSHALSYTYGMRWKTVRDTEYLFRDKDRHGNGKSLGPRSRETEALLTTFSAARSVVQERLRLITEKLDGHGMLGLLKKADKTFECVRENGYRAANAGQLMVDLVIAPREIDVTDSVTFSPSDLVAAEVPGLQWLLNAPKLATIAIDEDGWPVPIRAPDPRAFALHKAWLSSLTMREPLKKPRDLAQARAVAQLVQNEMPQFPFEDALTSLHGDVRKMLPVLIP